MFYPKKLWCIYRMAHSYIINCVKAMNTDKELRSRIMRSVKSKNTGLEKHFRSALHRAGLRFRLHPKLPGNPDLCFPKAKLACFVDSCFWHACKEHGSMPKSNHEFWQKKLQRTQKRDELLPSLYAETSWRVIRIWEHEINCDLPSVIQRVKNLVQERVEVVSKSAICGH